MPIVKKICWGQVSRVLSGHQKTQFGDFCSVFWAHIFIAPHVHRGRPFSHRKEAKKDKRVEKEVQEKARVAVRDGKDIKDMIIPGIIMVVAVIGSLGMDSGK